MQTEGLSLKDFNKAITLKAVSLALETAFKDSTLDFALFKQVIAKYQPESAALETQKMKVKYYNYKKDYPHALDALAGCFDTAAYYLPADDLATLIENNFKKMVENNRGDEFIAKIKQYRLMPDEAAFSYYPDVALLLIYHEMKDKEQTAALIQKIVGNADTPERLKTAVRKFGEDS